MAEVVGVSGVAFGCTDETYGYVQDVSINWQVTPGRALNGAGEVIAVGYYEKVGEYTIEMIIKVTADAADFYNVGKVISFTDGLSSDIASLDPVARIVERTKTNTGWYRVRVTGDVFPLIAATMTTTTTTT